jgi:processive 1,2-diacylglycerol beta-glucosyltransferase
LSSSAYPSIKKAVVYTLSPWEHALAYLRIISPLCKAGMEPINGVPQGVIDPGKVTEADLVVIQRDFPAHMQAYEKIMAFAHDQSKPVVVDLDDLLLALPENHPDRINHHYAGRLFPLLRAMLDADLVTVSTSQLAEHLSFLDPNIRVLPNYIDEQVWDLSTRQGPALPDQPIKIAYMGGDSHAPDFEPLIPVLIEILQTYPNQVMLQSVGMQLLSPLKDTPNAKAVSFLFDYPGYVDYVQGQHFDLAIAPLEDNTFNRCKSSMKYLEYSALGVPGVYSNLTPYSGLIKHGENGFLASSPQEWRKAILALVENPLIRWQMGMAAQETVRQDWLLGNHAQEWLEAYQFATYQVGKGRQDAALSLPLFADLTRQNRLWEEELETRLQQKEQETSLLNQKLLEKEQYIAALSSQIASRRSGLLGRINRGVRWISARFNARMGH